MTCSPGDLVLIPFPFSDLETAKRRPVLALTCPDRHGDFVGLALTSVPQSPPNIRIDTSHLSDGSLPKVSWVRVDKVFTIDHRLALKRLGRLNQTTLEQILDALCEQVGYHGRRNSTV
jgi:mRNA interferase MazF